MELIDTSSWIDALRYTGKLEIRARVQALLAGGGAALCNVVRLELWNGARGQDEKKGLRGLDQLVHNLTFDDLVWNVAIDLAQTARTAGLTVPADDLIIFACAKRYGVRLVHNDEHFARLSTL